MPMKRRLLEICLLLPLVACQTPQPVAPPLPPPAPACPEPPPPVQEANDLKAVLAYAEDLRKALALSQGRNTADLAQAASQLDAAAASTEPQIEPLKPLAVLLATRLAEQRRLQDGIDKLNQQLRESQRRNEQLNEKLEALKAIEQTLPAKR
jgi:ABC-type transporter Mla subunit MlaD